MEWKNVVSKVWETGLEKERKRKKVREDEVTTVRRRRWTRKFISKQVQRRNIVNLTFNLFVIVGKRDKRDSVKLYSKR